MKLNFGSGETRFDGFINIDLEPTSNPDVVCDIRKGALPFKDNSIEYIQMSHCIEHIELKYWDYLFDEFYRVMAPASQLFLAYPEFEMCAKYFLENHLGMRELFRATLYGRQLYPGDYHVVPMRTCEVTNFLSCHGFHDIKYNFDPYEDWNTILICTKGEKPLIRAEVIRREVLGHIKPKAGRFQLIED